MSTSETQFENTVAVTGMTCAACEKKVSKKLRALPGVDKVSASAVTGKVVFYSTAPVSDSDVRDAIIRAGYEVGRPVWFSHGRRVWFRAGVAFLAVGALVVLAIVAGLGDVAGNVTALGTGGLVLVGLVGLAAGFSTCMAMVGGVVLAISSTYQVNSSMSVGTKMRPHLVFQAGRIVGFVVLGALLGAFGAVLVLPALVQGLLMVLVAAVMVILGIRLTGVCPRLAGWSPRLPAMFAPSEKSRPYSDVRTAFAGAATFFLPCGFTQAVQLFALSTGSPLAAGLTMGVFALGTAPGLLGLAGLPSLASGARKEAVLAVVGVLLVGFGAINLYGASNVLGVGLPGTPVTADHALSTNVRREGPVQVVTMTQQDKGYVPEVTYVQAGVPIRWQITSESPLSCAAYMRAPDVGLRTTLSLGLNTVDLPALKPGKLPFACVMGMYRGELVAVSPPGQ